MRYSILCCAAALAFTAKVSLAQNDIGARVSQVRDGIVRVEYDARPGVCGDGKDMVGYKQAMFANSFESWGRWSNRNCAPGPVRVTMTLTGGVVTRLRTQIGGSWPSSDAKVTELGKIPGPAASAYFFSLVPSLESESGKDRVLLPAVLAEDAQPIAPLTVLARDTRRTLGTRRQAVQWLGLLGDARVVPTLVAMAREDNGESEKKSLMSSATAALSYLDNDAGVPALIELSRDRSPNIRHSTVFWLGQNADPRATRRLHEVIEDRAEESRVRSHAIFSLSHGDAASSAQFQYLRDLYSRIGDEKLKESIIQGMQEDDANGARWLLARARDENEPVKTRKSALFWLGQQSSSSTSDLVSVYRGSAEPSLREHAIFVLSQRDDNAATEALLTIAKDDSDKKMRGKALFWLAQKHDPRVTKLITDILR